MRGCRHAACIFERELARHASAARASWARMLARRAQPRARGPSPPDPAVDGGHGVRAQTCCRACTPRGWTASPTCTKPASRRRRWPTTTRTSPCSSTCCPCWCCGSTTRRWASWRAAPSPIVRCCRRAARWARPPW